MSSPRCTGGFGSKVTIFEESARLLPHEDEDVSAAVLDILQKEDIQVIFNAHDLTVKKLADGVSIHNVSGVAYSGRDGDAFPTLTIWDSTRSASPQTSMDIFTSTSTVRRRLAAFGP